MSDIKLNFGKYKGQSLSSVPMSYLTWLLTEYRGNSLSKGEIENEALVRGCEKRNGVWGISREKWNTGVGFDHQVDFLGNVITRSVRDDIEMGEDPWEYEGIPNSY